MRIAEIRLDLYISGLRCKTASRPQSLGTENPGRNPTLNNVGFGAVIEWHSLTNGSITVYIAQFAMPGSIGVTAAVVVMNSSALLRVDSGCFGRKMMPVISKFYNRKVNSNSLNAAVESAEGLVLRGTRSRRAVIPYIS